MEANSAADAQRASLQVLDPAGQLGERASTVVETGRSAAAERFAEELSPEAYDEAARHLTCRDAETFAELFRSLHLGDHANYLLFAAHQEWGQ